MKSTFIITIAITVTIIALGIFTGHMAYEVSQDYVKQSQAFSAWIRQESWDDAMEALPALIKDWQTTTQWLCIFVNHSDTDNVNLALGKLQAGIETKDLPLSYWALEELEEAFRHIYHRDALTLANVL